MLALAALQAVGAPLHRNYVYAKLLRDGKAPTWADFARDLDLDRSGAEAALQKLAADHDVVLLPSTSGAASQSYILMSHPFSNLPTAHFAEHDRDAEVHLEQRPQPRAPLGARRLVRVEHDAGAWVRVDGCLGSTNQSGVRV